MKPGGGHADIPTPEPAPLPPTPAAPNPYVENPFEYDIPSHIQTQLDKEAAAKLAAKKALETATAAKAAAELRKTSTTTAAAPAVASAAKARARLDQAQQQHQSTYGSPAHRKAAVELKAAQMAYDRAADRARKAEDQAARTSMIMIATGRSSPASADPRRAQALSWIAAPVSARAQAARQKQATQSARIGGAHTLIDRSRTYQTAASNPLIMEMKQAAAFATMKAGEHTAASTKLETATSKFDEINLQAMYDRDIAKAQHKSRETDNRIAHERTEFARYQAEKFQYDMTVYGQEVAEANRAADKADREAEWAKQKEFAREQAEEAKRLAAEQAAAAAEAAKKAQEDQKKAWEEQYNKQLTQQHVEAAWGNYLNWQTRQEEIRRDAEANAGNSLTQWGVIAYDPDSTYIVTADNAHWRVKDGVWYAPRNHMNKDQVHPFDVQFGKAGDVPFTVDGKPAVYRPSTGEWIIGQFVKELQDGQWTNTPTIAQRFKFGKAGDVPFVYNGRPAVYRPSTGTIHIGTGLGSDQIWIHGSPSPDVQGTVSGMTGFGYRARISMPRSPYYAPAAPLKAPKKPTGSHRAPTRPRPADPYLAFTAGMGLTPRGSTSIADLMAPPPHLPPTGMNPEKSPKPVQLPADPYRAFAAGMGLTRPSTSASSPSPSRKRKPSAKKAVKKSIQKSGIRGRKSRVRR